MLEMLYMSLWVGDVQQTYQVFKTTGKIFWEEKEIKNYIMSDVALLYSYLVIMFTY